MPVTEVLSPINADELMAKMTTALENNETQNQAIKNRQREIQKKLVEGFSMFLKGKQVLINAHHGIVQKIELTSDDLQKPEITFTFEGGLKIIFLSIAQLSEIHVLGPVHTTLIKRNAPDFV